MNGRAIGPALGVTGRNFPTYVLPMLSSCGLRLYNDVCYRNIWLIASHTRPFWQAQVVAVPIDESVRDVIWKALWNECSQVFLSRLGLYAPTIILNGCTSKLKGLVQVVVELNELIMTFYNQI